MFGISQVVTLLYFWGVGGQDLACKLEGVSLLCKRIAEVRKGRERKGEAGYQTTMQNERAT